MNSVKQILSKIPDCRAAVIGDFTLDFYIATDPESGEISIETGLATLPVRNFCSSPGGAGNVAVNLAVLGVEKISAFGVTGSDMFGRELLKKLEKKQIDISGMVIQEKNWITNVYTKILKNGTEGNRIDFGNFNLLENTTADRLLSNLKTALPDTDILIINQQLISGIHSDYFRKQLVKLLNRSPETLCITDSRDFSQDFRGTSRKINREEAFKVLEKNGIKLEESWDKDLKAAKELYNIWEKPVFLTRGERGIIVCSSTGCMEIPGIQILSEIDTVGAGDTALAAIAAATGSGFPSHDAAVIGNLAAAVTVKKLHTTGTASPEEIQKMENEAVYIYNPELALNHSKAEYLKNSEIEIIKRSDFDRNIKFALFDHDGTISTLRQGWEEVMHPMMTESIIGEADIDSSLYRIIQARVSDFIDKTTGLMTLIQMDGLTNLIREFRLVPENMILDIHEYKKIYNKRLMQLVNRRIEKLGNMELDIQDVTIKGAVDFLEKLREKGVILYLASGTDEEDVKKEAELLGYNDLFNGGIFGASDDIADDPKKAVISRIIKTVGSKNAENLITFGDGPVEIAQTVNAGGISVGIASDEVRRYSLNREKRERLIKAGADFIIPDYSQQDILLDLILKR